MKRRELLRILETHGFEFIRNGANHDIYQREKIKIAVPRHKEIKETLAKIILKEAGIELE